MPKIIVKTKDPCGGHKTLYAKPETTLDDACELAENEVYYGYSCWAGVYVDEELYMEVEI